MKANKKDDKVEVCKTRVINLEKVARVREKMPEDDEITELAETFKVLSDPTRLRIVLSLSMEELCVCDMTTLIKTSISAISHQLRLLKNRKLVTYRKEGKIVYYSLNDQHVIDLINSTLEHIRE